MLATQLILDDLRRRCRDRDYDPGTGTGCNSRSNPGDNSKRHAMPRQINALLTAPPKYIRIPSL